MATHQELSNGAGETSPIPISSGIEHMLPDTASSVEQEAPTMLQDAPFIYNKSARSDQVITDDGQQKPVAIKHFDASPLTPPRTPTLAKAVPPLSFTTIPTPGAEDSAEDSTEASPVDPTSLNSKATQTSPFTDSDLVPALQSARTEHLCRLADLFTNLTTLATAHDNTLSVLYTTKITALEARIAASLQTQNDLTAQIAALSIQHDSDTADLAALRAQLAQAREDHARETLARAEATHALLARKDDEFARGIEAMRVEMEERVAQVMEEMAAQVKHAREEMALRGDERVAAVKEEMARQRGELGRLLEGEREARRKAEMGRRDGGYHGNERPLQAWAVARLWGVGQGRSR